MQGMPLTLRREKKENERSEKGLAKSQWQGGGKKSQLLSSFLFFLKKEMTAHGPVLSSLCCKIM